MHYKWLFGALATERICSVRFVYDHNQGRLKHWPPSTSAKFSLFVTDQSKSTELIIRFVGRFMTPLSHDLQSTMLSKKDLTTPLVTRWQSSANYTHQCKYKRLKTSPTQHVRAIEELAKGKHVFEEVLQ